MYTRRAVHFTCLLALVLTLAACGEKNSGPKPGQNSGQKASPGPAASHLARPEGLAILSLYSDRLLLDDAFSDEEIGALGFDFKKLRGLRIDPSPHRAAIEKSGPHILDEAYEAIFGGPQANPINYFFERSKILVSAHTPLMDEPMHPLMAAQNLSLVVWVNQMLSQLEQGRDPGAIPDVVQGGLRLSMNSSRYGLLQLGAIYPTIPDSVDRIATLLHEARHSDCPTGLTQSQLTKLKDEGDSMSGDDVVALFGTCSFPHPKCPPGHPLEDLHACDSGEGWGPYATMLPYYKMIFGQCSNCTEEERQAALVGAADAMGRVIRLEDLLERRLGMPDMRQQGFKK